VVRAAVLCNTASKIGTADRWAERIAAVEHNGVAGCADMIVNNWFGPDYEAQTDRLALHRTMVARSTDAGYTAACHAIRDADLTDFAKAITIPVLCIGGAHDKSVPIESVQNLAANIPDGEAVIVDSLGHLPCLEMPKELARLIAEFDPAPSNMGMTIRRKVLSDAHVDKAAANVTLLDQAFQDLITESAWGTVWASPGIAPRERSMLTLALLAATGNFEEIPMHIRATARTGATERDITEAFQHVAIYAGVPKANHALKLAKQTLIEMKDLGDD